MPSLDDVTQRFIADTAGYIGPMREMIEAAKEFRDATAEDDASSDELRDSLDRLTDAVWELLGPVDDLAATLKVNGEALDSVRDKGAEAAEGLKQVRDASVEDDAALDGVRNRADETASAFSRLRDKAVETAGALGLVDAAAEGEGGEGSGLLGTVALWGSLVVAIAAVLPAVAAVAASFGAFAAFAYPAVSQVVTAIEGGSSAIAKLPVPLQTVANGVLNLESAWKKLAGTFQPQVIQIMNQALGIADKLLPEIVPLAQAGGKAISSMLSMLGQGLQSQGFLQFLKTMTALAVPATQAIMRLLGALMQFINATIEALAPLSVPFINTITMLVKVLSGPLVAAFKLVIEIFVGLASALSPVLPLLSKFATVLINDVGSSFAGLIPMVKQLAEDLLPSLRDAVKVIEPLLAYMLTPNSPLMTALGALLKMLPSTLHFLDEIMNFLAGHPMFTRLAVDILSAYAALKILSGWFSSLTSALSIFTNPVFLVIAAIALLALGFYELYEHSAEFRKIVKDVGEALKDDLEAGFKAAAAIIKWFEGAPLTSIKSALKQAEAWWKQHGKEVEQIVSAWLKMVSTEFTVAMKVITTVIKVALAVLVPFWKASFEAMEAIMKFIWPVIASVVTTAIHLIVNIISVALDLLTGHWSQAWHDMGTLVSQLLTGMANTAKDIIDGLANVLFTAGEHVIDSLIDGIKSRIGGITSVMGGVAGMIADAIGHSPAKYGPLSGSGAPEIRGLHLAQDLARGILAGRSQVQAAISAVAGAAGASIGGTTAASASPGVHVTVPVSLAPGLSYTNPQFLNGMQQVIQESILRYTQVNQSNGMFGFQRRS